MTGTDSTPFVNPAQALEQALLGSRVALALDADGYLLAKRRGDPLGCFERSPRR